MNGGTAADQKMIEDFLSYENIKPEQARQTSESILQSVAESVHQRKMSNQEIISQFITTGYVQSTEMTQNSYQYQNQSKPIIRLVKPSEENSMTDLNSMIPDYKIQNYKLKLQQEGQTDPFGYEWKTSSYLPEGWLCRDDNSHNIRLQTPEGVKLRTYKTAKEYMEADPKYTEEDVEKLFLYPDGQVSNAKRLIRTNKDSLQQPYSKDLLQQVSVQLQHPKIQNVISPVLLASTRVESGWETNEFLPQGWLHKPRQGREINLLTPEGIKLRSYKAAFDLMAEGDDFSQEDIDRLALYPDGQQARLRPEDWSASPYLPQGWRCKEGRPEDRHIFLLAPEVKKQLTTYKAVAAHMTEYGYTQVSHGVMGSDLIGNLNMQNIFFLLN